MTSLGTKAERANFRFLEVIALLLILVLAAYLRLENHTDNPGWYTDEGTHLDIAQNLVRGQTQYLAINQSTLLFAKMPLFESLLAGWLRVGGGGIGTLRVFTSVLGVVSVALLYWVVRSTQESGDVILALLSALMFAIYPQAVLYSRWGFSYNLLTPLVLLTYLALWKYLEPQAISARRGWLLLAALAIGIGIVSDLWMLTLVVPLLLVASTRQWRGLPLSLLLVSLPLGLYAAVMLIQAPQAFLFDVRFTLSRLGRLSLLAQMRTLVLNYATLFFQDVWMALGSVGLFVLRPARLQRLSLLLFLFPLVVLGRTVALYSLSFYYMIPLLPFIGLGMAALIRRGVPSVAQQVREGLYSLFRRWGWWPAQPRWQRLGGKFLTTGAYLAVVLVVMAPFFASAWLTADQARNRFSTQIDPFLIDPRDARQVAAFIHQRVSSDDVVIATPGLAWLIQAKTADLQMSIAATGRETLLLPADIPASRFAFDPEYTRARFVVVDNLWRNWAVWDIPGAADMLREVETWPQVFRAGALEVYSNPARN